jgi:hypothetical protein
LVPEKALFAIFSEKTMHPEPIRIATARDFANAAVEPAALQMIFLPNPPVLSSTSEGDAALRD